ncbi:hypothetical protein B0T17DRAFT_510247 [Bombardia bombarda]|uniref:Uncharacterized protein n=1 Tax=Bombardia bombarda TaxID=252184 RepID=A0AA40BW03_9PEZI|nr:hypothetical protein B0T17DRAFT_510247 [Bombardia bombarda]
MLFSCPYMALAAIIIFLQLEAAAHFVVPSPKKTKRQDGTGPLPLSRIVAHQKREVGPLFCGLGFSIHQFPDGQDLCCSDNTTSSGERNCSQPIVFQHGGGHLASDPVTLYEVGSDVVIVFTDPATTVTVISTLTETLTINDPAAKTQTWFATVTSCLPHSRRAIRASVIPATTTATPIPTSLVTSRIAAPISIRSIGADGQQTVPLKLLPTSAEIQKRAAMSEAATMIHQVETVTRQRTVITTITRSIFLDVVIAPNAITAIYSTVTALVRCSKETTQEQGRSLSKTSIYEVLTTSGTTTTKWNFPHKTSSGAPSVTTSSSISALPESSSETTFSTTSSLSSSPLSSISTVPEIFIETSSVTTITTIIQSGSISSLSGTSSEMSSSLLSTVSETSPTAMPIPTSMPTSTANDDGRAWKIASIVLGVIFGLVLLATVLYYLRRAMQRRRGLLACLHQRLEPAPGTPDTRNSMSSGPNGGGSGVSSVSGLTGQGEVRVIVRPAPGRYPLVSTTALARLPGLAGHSPGQYVEISPRADVSPGSSEWSARSERGTGTRPGTREVAERAGGGSGSSGGWYLFPPSSAPRPVARGAHDPNLPPWHEK